MGKSTFMIRQRAFLKLYLINLSESGRLYGLGFLEVLKEDFRPFGYKPTHSEIYKSLHELMNEGVLERRKKLKEGASLQEIAVYRIKDQGKADLYKKQVKHDLDRCQGLIKKALKDNYS